MAEKRFATPPGITLGRHSEQRLFPPRAESCELSVACPPAEYSASRIARAVEDVDAHLLNLNVTSEPAASAGEIVVDLRVSHRHASAVARSLERYGFRIVSLPAGTSDPWADSMGSRIDELLMHLSI